MASTSSPTQNQANTVQANDPWIQRMIDNDRAYRSIRTQLIMINQRLITAVGLERIQLICRKTRLLQEFVNRFGQQEDHNYARYIRSMISRYQRQINNIIC